MLGCILFSIAIHIISLFLFLGGPLAKKYGESKGKGVTKVRIISPVNSLPKKVVKKLPKSKVAPKPTPSKKKIRKKKKIVKKIKRKIRTVKKAKTKVTAPAVTKKEVVEKTPEEKSLPSETSRESNRVKSEISSGSKKIKITSWQNYMFAITRKINNKKKYPKRARRGGLTGKVGVRLTLSNSGEIKNVQIYESSGHSVLDKAALSSILKMNPFKPFPEEIKSHSDKSFTFRLSYDLK